MLRNAGRKQHQPPLKYEEKSPRPFSWSQPPFGLSDRLGIPHVAFIRPPTSPIALHPAETPGCTTPIRISPFIRSELHRLYFFACFYLFLLLKPRLADVAAAELDVEHALHGREHLLVGR